MGESHLLSGEAHSMADIELSEEQKALIHKMKKLGKKKIIAVISSGRPLALESVENDLDAILYIWHTGSKQVMPRQMCCSAIIRRRAD